MRLTFGSGPGWVIARMSGELDISSAKTFRQKVDLELKRAGVPNLILSLNDLDFIDSTGLGSVLGRHKHITSSGGNMILVDIPPKIMSMIEMAGLASVLRVARSLDEALGILEGAEPRFGGRFPGEK